VEHIERITALIVEICGTSHTQVGPIDDQIVNIPLRQPVVLRTARAQKVIGVPVTDEMVADIFNRLGLRTATRRASSPSRRRPTASISRSRKT
jgi:phenylalanyl-tRNA synthetase beta chain